MVPVYIDRVSYVDGSSLKDLPLASLIGNPNMLRRMSRLIRMGVAAGLMCLDGLSPDEVDAIVTATSLGGLEDTGKFLEEISSRNESSLNPTPFMRSTFNTVGAQIALLKGIRAYNVTYVHRGLSLESALTDAMLQIAEGRRNVLAGAFDEITPESHAVKERLGFSRKGWTDSEGAGFMLLCSEHSENTLAELCGLRTWRGTMDADGAGDAVRSFLGEHGLGMSDVTFFSPETAGCSWTGSAGRICGAAGAVGDAGTGYVAVYSCSTGMYHSAVLLRRP